MFSSVQFRLYSVSVLLSKRHKWSAAPISACLRRGPRGCFCSECCTGSESVAAPRLNCSLPPTHQHRARVWRGRKCCFSSLRYDPSPDRESNPIYQLRRRVLKYIAVCFEALIEKTTKKGQLPHYDTFSSKIKPHI